MSRVANSQKLPQILRPFARMDIEDVNWELLAEMYNIVKDASVMECLLIMSCIFERSHREFLILDPKELSSGKAIGVHLNLTFANRRGIFYTPPTVQPPEEKKIISHLQKCLS